MLATWVCYLLPTSMFTSCPYSTFSPPRAPGPSSSLPSHSFGERTEDSFWSLLYHLINANAVVQAWAELRAERVGTGSAMLFYIVWRLLCICRGSLGLSTLGKQLLCLSQDCSKKETATRHSVTCPHQSVYSPK